MSTNELENELEVAVMLKDIDMWEAAKIMEGLHIELNYFAVDLLEEVLKHERPELVKLAREMVARVDKPLLGNGRLKDIHLGSLHVIINIVIPSWIETFSGGVLSSLAASYIYALFHSVRGQEGEKGQLLHDIPVVSPVVLRALGLKSSKRFQRWIKRILPLERTNDLEIIYSRTVEVQTADEVVHRESEYIKMNYKI